VREPAERGCGADHRPHHRHAGQFDGIAGFQDLLEFFGPLPNPDKQYAVMPGVAHASFHQTNYRIARHILQAFFTQPTPGYRA
jgi:hypothetical protein